ncbi:LAQU0S04e07954g1_1 [Lachancea quebecensis]|uniref:LAQU0S04e07954g1_1 n=1 Tax=Lachancea quebecensis TaxID=1654605 RepID=A0A0P1KY36_9SACH|nr:LAQU0S04e07954g1_1 [Lachancea quebecensis]
MSANQLIGQYFPIEKQAELLQALSTNGRFGEMYEVLDTMKFDDQALEIATQCTTEQVLKDFQAQGDAEEWDTCRLQELAKLTSKLPNTFGALQDWVVRVLDQNEQVSNDRNVKMLLEFLEQTHMYSEGQQLPKSTKLDKQLVKLMQADDSELAEVSSKVLKWKILDLSRNCMEDKDFDLYVWDELRKVFSCNTDTLKLKNGYLFVLRFLIEDRISPHLHDFITSDLFWESLKRGLEHDVHDLRKFSLSILKLTLQKLSPEELFTNNWIKWTPESYAANITAWKKFTTLYEIVALDTALNQFEAASAEILDLFGNDLLNPRWVLVIFSTGLKASMESVRRHTVRLLLRIKEKSVFQTSLNELSAVFLPAAMYAPYFSVIEKKCPYGELVTQFVTELVLHASKNEPGNGLSEMVYAILSCLYQQRTSFEPAKIYIILGLYDALRLTKARPIGENHIELIAKSFESESEDEVFETTLQTTYLKLLMHIKVDLSPYTWIDALSRHVKAKNGNYRYIAPLIDDFIDVSVQCFDKNQIQELLLDYVNDDSTFQAMAYLIFNALPGAIEPHFLKELSKYGEAQTQFNENFSSLLSDLVSAKLPNSAYQCSHELTKLSVFGPAAWCAVDLHPLYQSLMMDFDAEKFKFFVCSYQQTVEHTMCTLELTLDDFLKLYAFLKKHCQENVSNGFKYKDSIYSDFFVFLLSFLKCYALDLNTGTKSNELNSILETLNSNVLRDNGNYQGNLAIIKVLHYLLSNYVTPRIQDFDRDPQDDGTIVLQAVQILCSIWDSTSDERLVLNQKDLHLSFIECMFHPSVFFFALTYKDSESPLAEILSKYGKSIIQYSYSRRTLLPVLSQQINAFMEIYGKTLEWQQHNNNWLIILMFQAFTQNQVAVNGFKLKPIIAKAFDQQIDRLGSHSMGLYERVYNMPEVSARIFIISALLHTNNEFKEKALAYMLKNDENLLKAKKSTDGAEELGRLLKWQLLLLTVKSVDHVTLSKYIKEEVLPSIVTEASPLVRAYMEWASAIDLAQTYSEAHSKDNEDALFDMLKDHSKPLLSITAERILFIALKGLSTVTSCDRLLQRFIAELIPNCTSNKPLIRHFSNSLMLSFWPAFESLLQEGTLRNALKNLYENAQKTQVHGQFRLGDAVIWDLDKDFTLANIFGGVILKSTDHEVPYIESNIFRRYLTCVDKVAVGEDEKHLWLRKRTKQKQEVEGSLQKDSPLQTKSGAWETVMDIENQNSAATVKRSPLIVIASLVDKAPNLGGICRLCDVLGAGLLTVHDVRIKNHPQFKSVAVTADRWMPMEAVATHDITKFMRSKKQEGYTLIGLEQTDKSIQLDNRFQFPPKSLILLGTEAEGIPGHLLSELDLCLEIKQSGVIRSMNIQTATAVIVHAYSAQHT